MPAAETQAGMVDSSAISFNVFIRAWQDVFKLPRPCPVGVQAADPNGQANSITFVLCSDDLGCVYDVRWQLRRPIRQE